MFYEYVNSFNWSVDNFGATLNNAGIGTTVTADASAHTKGSAVSLIAGASVTSDAFGIMVFGTGGDTSGASYGYLGDLLIDPAGGTSWSVLVNNLMFHNPCYITGAWSYYFPLYLKSGTSIGFQVQSSTGGRTMQACVKVYGKPTNEQLVKVGSKVETFGADTANTRGTAITVGNAVMGDWTNSLGTLSYEEWFWQSGGIRYASDASISDVGGLIEVGVGDASNKTIVGLYPYTQNSAEEVGKDAFGIFPPYSLQKAGNYVYVRASSITTPDSNTYTTAYGVGG